MNIQQDFAELLKLLEEHHVEYMIVGGYAVAFHGHPRFTKDIDFFYNNTTRNVQNLIECLISFGFPQSDFSQDVFLTPGNIITFGVEPVRVDIINEISGVTFTEAWPKHVRGKYGDIEVNFISKIDLIKNKLSTTRLQDKADAEALN
jgi:predicted nucleotidyltransferase